MTWNQHDIHRLLSLKKATTSCTDEKKEACSVPAQEARFVPSKVEYVWCPPSSI